MNGLKGARQWLATIGVALGLGLGLYLVLSWQPSREVWRGFEQKSRSIALILSRGVEAAVEFDDLPAISSNLEAAGDEGSIAYTKVFKADGFPLHVSQRAPKGDYAELRKAELQDLTDGTMYIVVLPLKGGKGWLEVGYGIAEVNQALSGTRAVSALAAAVLSILVGIAIAVVRRSSTNRLTLLEQIASTSSRLRLTSREIQSVCNEQAASTTQQSGAVEETRRTMEALLEASKRISSASRAVFENADRTARTAQTISDGIRLFTQQAQKISDISETIRAISDKSDLLALNASLEGTKAGEAGRGFALVAAEMRRLAESVVNAAREIKDLASNIRAVSDASASAAEEGRGLASRTSESAKEITLVTEQQSSATEQVTRSMDEVSVLLQRMAASTGMTEKSARALGELSTELNRLTAVFAQERAAA